MKPFVLSSFDPVPERFMLGFGWAGADLVIGNEGYQGYRAARSKDMQPGEDGAYIVVSRNAQEISIGTDFCGYAKLFLYSNGDVWAVSSSFYDLADFVNGRGLPLTLSEPQLRAFMISGHLGQQLMSLATSAREIKLIPARCKIVITKGTPSDTIRVVPSAAAEAIDSEAASTKYNAALGKYLGTWIGRFKTMFESGLDIPIDLSGGRDSRAVLGLALLACDKLGISRDRFYVRSSVQKQDDFKVAQAIASEFRLDLNRTFQPPEGDGASVYQAWKQHALGVYAPVYFFDPGMWRFSLTGGGGESHRPFYPAPDLDQVLGNLQALSGSDSPWNLPAALAGKMPSLGAFFGKASGLLRFHPDYELLRRDAHEGLASVRAGYEASLDEMVVHYRHFRDRFHFGLGAVERSNVSPLASKSLRLASALCGRERFTNAQVIADLMMACNQRLAAMPFDKASKALTGTNMQDRTEPTGIMDHVDGGGRVFGGKENAADHPANGASKNPILELVEDFEESDERIRSMDLLPKAYIEEARKSAARMRKAGKRDRTADYHAIRISHVVLAGELVRLARPAAAG